jgi:anti-sigma factor RsiW
MPEIRHTIEPEEMMAYLDGELPAARAAEAMTHLERCAECQRLAADLRRVSQEMTAWQVEPPRAMAAPVAVASPPARQTPFRISKGAWALSGVALLLGVVLLSSHSPRSEPSADSSVGWDPVSPSLWQRIAPAPRASATHSMPLAAPAPAVPPAAPSPSAPMIERTATLNLATRDFDQIRSRIDAVLARRHGYLAELTLSAPQGAGRSLGASLRIPAAELDATLAELRQLGRVENESQKGEDVTRQYVDLVARLANARNTEQRLAQMLAQRTGKLSDVLDVEREISRVRGEIEQMEAERRTTADLVAFATVRLNASEDYQAQIRLSPDSTMTRLHNAAVEGYQNLAGGLVSLALVLLAYGPSVFLWVALILLIGLWLAKRRKSAQL